MPFLLKKTFKYLLRFIAGFIAFILLYLLASFCLSRITVDKEKSTMADVDIYIKTNGVHTDLVVPVKNDQMDWSKEIKFSNTALKDTAMAYLGLGWGDKGFYLETPQWKDLKFKTAFNAAFALGNTAMHATFYGNLAESETCKKISISKEQYSRLISYIKESFQTDANNHFKFIATKANYSDADAFYEANGNYSLFHTCNTWANSGLKACGQKCCLWTPFDTGIFLKYK
jgi:uncharacterized protein (TIGR02117 family)